VLRGWRREEGELRQTALATVVDEDEARWDDECEAEATRMAAGVVPSPYCTTRHAILKYSIFYQVMKPIT
jgi:hypothetical protein